MSDRFRYLPCALHPALSFKWVFVGTCPGQVILPNKKHGVDLSDPAGWDHAVRALCLIRGIDIPESASVAFAVDHEWGRVFLLVNGDPVDDADGQYLDLGVHPDEMRTPAGRREALCRCICAALGLEVDGVFPVERAP